MNRNYGWVIVGAGLVMTCVAMGAMFALPVIKQTISHDMGWSDAGISSSMTIGFLAMGLAGFGWGALSDRFGPMIVTLAGSILLGLGLVLASRAVSLLQFQLAYGLVVGIAGGSFFPPLMASVTGWFEKHRSLAVSLVSAGVGIAPMTMAPFAGWLIEHRDWRTTQLTLALIALAVTVPMSLLIRRPPAVAMDAPNPGASIAEEPHMAVGPALRSPQFVVLALTFFACCATHSGPIFHTVSYAVTCGIPVLTAVSIYSIEGVGGLVGRVLIGLAGDRFGAKRVLVAGLLVQAAGAGAYFFVRSLEGFYSVAAIFGFAYGGVMPLYAVIAREYFGVRIMGTVFGAAALVSSLGMALGPVVGGWIFDTFGGYGWLYVASSAIGFGAAAIALAFPPFPSERRAALNPA
ncbi:MAG TPA: MFS transporter [Dongiaceae bacterium]|nr:MFS transporter [Dongiaceae bacterium]